MEDGVYQLTEKLEAWVVHVTNETLVDIIETVDTNPK